MARESASASPYEGEGVPTPGMHVLKFVGEDGRTVELEPHDGKRFRVEPLDFVQFVRAAETKSPTFQVVIHNTRAPTAQTGLERDGPLTTRATLSNNGPIIAYGLVEGGWLPMPWAHKKVAWIDRNVVIALEKLKVDVEAQQAPGDPAWLARWLGMDTEHVSPILFALEGGQRRPPTDFEMRAELSRAARALDRVLQGAKIQKIDSMQRRALHRMALEHAEARGRATRLLLQAAPLVDDRVKPELRQHLEDRVLELARQERVRIGSLTVLALLSCVYDANPVLSTHRAATPGRAVIKPRADYQAADAYNALADLYFVELLVNAHAMFPDVEPVLYTRDVGIAAMWTALQPCEQIAQRLPNGKHRTTVTFTLTTGLFPALNYDEVVGLKTRLAM